MMDIRQARPTRLLAAAGIVCAAIVVFALVGRVAPVVESGALIPSLPGYEVDRVELSGVRWIVDRHVDSRDLLTAAVFLVAAAVTFAAALVVRRPGSADAAPTFAALGCAALFLALDEALAIHETLGHNLDFLDRLPAEHADDVILPLYGVLALALVPGVLRLLQASRLATVLLGSAVVMAGLAVLIDLGRVPGPEEVAELAAALLALAGFAVLVVVWVRPPADGPAPPRAEAVTSAEPRRQA